mgnify:CR=1 FL=1
MLSNIEPTLQLSLLEKRYTQERRSNAGRIWIDSLILEEMVILQQMLILNNEEL